MARTLHLAALALLLCRAHAQCAFPLPTVDEQCFGLSSYPLISTPDQCQQACCSLGEASCVAWQWCAPGAACQPTQKNASCWVGVPGQSPGCKAAPGWIGGLRSTQPAQGQYYNLALINASLLSGLHIRHCDDFMSLKGDSRSGASVSDFVWRLVAGLDGSPNTVSLEASNYYFRYAGMNINANSSTLIMGTEFPEYVADLSDLSFFLVPGLDDDRFFSLQIASSNPQYALKYATAASTNLGPCPETNTLDLVLADGYAPGVFNGVSLGQTFAFLPVSVIPAVSWHTEHHDAQNTGFSAWDGPGETTGGVCTEELIKTDPSSPTSPTFLSSGVVSTADGWWYGGDSNDDLHLLEDLLVVRQNGETWNAWKLSLPSLLGISQPATPYGIRGSPTSASTANTADRFLYVASANGYVAAINTLYCNSAALPKPVTGPGGGGGGGGAVPGSLRAARAAARAGAAAADASSAAGAAAPAAAAPQPTRLLDGDATLGGSQWAVYSHLNAIYAADRRPNTFYNSTTITWPECQALCWANHTGDPDTGCVTWVWHDPSVVPATYANKCYFKTVPGFNPVSQAGHYTGFLTVTAPGPHCVAWSRPISSDPNPLKPSYASPRLVTYSGITALLVSDTDADLNTNGVLHAFSAGNGTELWSYSAIDPLPNPPVSYGLMGIVPAQLPQAPSVLLLAYGSRIAAIDMNACVLGASCTEVASWDSTPQESGLAYGGDSFVSSIALRPDGAALFVHSSTGILWKLGVSVLPGPPVTVSFAFAWACVYDRKQANQCTPPPAALGALYGGAGGWYQPSTRAQTQELHAEIAALHAQRFGAAAGAPRGLGEEGNPLQLTLRLAHELPRAELLAIRTPGGYYRKGANGRPCVGERDPNFGLYPFATPALWWDYYSTQDPDIRNPHVAIVDFSLAEDSALFLVDDATGYPISTSAGDPFFLDTLDLPDGVTTAAFGRSRSSPAFDRQGHIYVASDLDFDGNPSDNDTYPVLFCVDGDTAAVKWVVGLGEEDVSYVGSSSPAVAAGPRGENRVCVNYTSAEGRRSIAPTLARLSYHLFTNAHHSPPPSPLTTHRYMAISDNVASLSERQPGTPKCPTSSYGLAVCSDHGDCDCATGACACADCWGGDASCSTFTPNVCLNGGTCGAGGNCQCANKCSSGPLCGTLKDCRNGGSCSPADGTCQCPGVCSYINAFGVCALDASLCGGEGSTCSYGGVCTCAPSSCLTGAACDQPVDCGVGGNCSSAAGGACLCSACYATDALGKCSVLCSGHGTCAGGGACVCSGGYSGPQCSIPPLSPSPAPGKGGGGSSAVQAARGLSPGAAAAVGILVPTALLLGGVYAFMALVHPGKPLSAAGGLLLEQARAWGGGGGAGAYRPMGAVPGLGGAAAASARAAGGGAGASATRLASLAASAPPAVNERMSLLNASRGAAPSAVSRPVFGSL